MTRALKMATAARPSTSRMPSSSGQHARLQDKPLQRKPAGALAGTRVPGIVHDVLRTPGRALDEDTRSFMEERFAHDFARVRVHTDARAAQSAEELRARAYTVGHAVVFAANQYSPGTPSGRRLLAHELTHVVQQGSAPAIHSSVAQAARVHGIQRMADDDSADSEPAIQTEVIDLEAGEGGAMGAGAPAAAPPPAAPPEADESAPPQINAAAAATLAGAGVAPQHHATECEADRVADRVISDRPHLQAPPIMARLGAFGGINLDAKPKVVKRIDIAFIMGSDKPKSKNKFYTAAKKYFKVNLPGVELIDDPKIRDLAAVFSYVRDRGDAVGNLYLISHAADDGTLSFPLKPGDKDKKVDYAELKKARKTSPELFELPKGVVDKSTTIRIKGCRLGQSARMLGEIGGAFGAGKVIAPKHRQYYEYETKVSGKGKSRKEETTTYQGFKTYFIERPGKVTLKRDEQVDAFAAKYSQLAKADWEKLIPKKGGLKASVDTRQPLSFTNTEPDDDKQALAVAKARFTKEKVKPKKTLSHTDTPKKFELTLTDGTVKSWAGKSVTWEFEATDGGTANITLDMPTDDKEIIDSVKADESVPEVYDWKLNKKRVGSNVAYTVECVRTVYAVDQYIVDKIASDYKKHLYVPAETTKEFFGEYDAPPDPVKPTPPKKKTK